MRRALKISAWVLGSLVLLCVLLVVAVLIIGNTDPPPNIPATSPASTAMPAGPPPRYGTCVSLMPASCFSISMAR